LAACSLFPSPKIAALAAGFCFEANFADHDGFVEGLNAASPRTLFFKKWAGGFRRE
jgi:hypothetical protein